MDYHEPNNNLNIINIKKNILYLNFNQDYSCICVGTEYGFIIYNVTPLKEIYKRSN
jgi:autophagy-related protein 18